MNPWVREPTGVCVCVCEPTGVGVCEPVCVCVHVAVGVEGADELGGQHGRQWVGRHGVWGVEPIEAFPLRGGGGRGGGGDARRSAGPSERCGSGQCCRWRAGRGEVRRVGPWSAAWAPRPPLVSPNSRCPPQTIADIIRTCLGPRAMMKVSAAAVPVRHSE